MKFKKILSIIMAVSVLLCIGAAAFADDEASAPTPTPTEAIPSPDEGDTTPQTPSPSATPEVIEILDVPVVTKDPSAENVTAGGKIVFVAHADNSFSVQWFVVSKDGNSTISADGMSAVYPGVVVSGCYDDRLVIDNATMALNGCSAYAVFTSSTGEQVKTAAAGMTVTAATPTPTATPTATPAATPTPEATPIPTAQIQPVETPEASSTPAPSPTETPDEETGSGHSGTIIFLLIIGIILLGTAVVLILYVKGVIRLDWLENKLGGDEEDSNKKR